MMKKKENKLTKKLMVIDAQNQFIRAYIVDPSLSTNGSPIGGLKGFMKIMNKLCREIKPDAVAVVWDGEGGSQKRKSMNKDYKAGRKPPRLNRYDDILTEEEKYANRIWQQVRAIEYINNTPIMQFYVPLVEADDVISYIVGLSHYTEWNKVIVSSDKDFIQLLGEDTLLFRPTQKEVLNKNRILEKYKIHPNNFALARALVGDKSDNLKGVQGVGLSTVAKRFPFLSEEKEYYIDDLLEVASEEVEKSKLRVYGKILEAEDVVRLNYKIMQLGAPQISIQSKQKIQSTCENHVPEFNKTELVKLMIKDGMGQVSLHDLYQTFQRVKANYLA
jgi:DNA polymerase-1